MTMSEAVTKAKAIADSHTDDYVKLPADVLATLASHEKVKAHPSGRDYAMLAETARTTKQQTVSLHRTAHLAAILTAVSE